MKQGRQPGGPAAFVASACSNHSSVNSHDASPCGAAEDRAALVEKGRDSFGKIVCACTCRK